MAREQLSRIQGSIQGMALGAPLPPVSGTSDPLVFLTSQNQYNPSLVKRYKETMCALLNQPGGGCIVFGVKDDDLKIVGWVPGGQKRGCSNGRSPTMDDLKVALSLHPTDVSADQHR
jgi:hypothetical protein